MSLSAFPNTAKDQKMLFFLNCIQKDTVWGHLKGTSLIVSHPPSDYMFGKRSSSAMNKCMSHFMMVQFHCCQ